MKTFFKKLGEFFQNPDGSLSSRRLAGIALVVCALVGYFKRLDLATTSVILGGGLTLLGLTTADQPKGP